MTDPPTLFDAHLPSLTAGELHGLWHTTCLRPAPTGDSRWAEATHLQLHQTHFSLHTRAGDRHAGTWHLQRHSRLGQPFLALQEAETPVLALITRLRRSADGTVRQMVVYFQSGLELQLTHP
ncbi:hypothetical protein [Hymenobacter koreensis]|uniref:hypothetical protein n=1 Tax=Hymenobacter koreensis TaxID=1084523 RepID=UPI0031EB25A5